MYFNSFQKRYQQLMYNQFLTQYYSLTAILNYNIFKSPYFTTEFII